MNGWEKEVQRKRWQSAWACPQVSKVPVTVQMCIVLTRSNGSEKFDTRDVKWAPDGKGLILMDRDTFCCAFEVETDEVR